METLYGIQLNDQNMIIGKCTGDVVLEGYIELTEEEFELSNHYMKYNPETKEFSEKFETPDQNKELQDKDIYKKLAELEQQNKEISNYLLEIDEILSEI